MVVSCDLHRQHLQGLSWVLLYNLMSMVDWLSRAHIFAIRNFQQLWHFFTLLGKSFWKSLIHSSSIIVCASHHSQFLLYYTTLEENMATRTETDWSQVYTARWCWNVWPKTFMVRTADSKMHKNGIVFRNINRDIFQKCTISRMLDVLQRIGLQQLLNLLQFFCHKRWVSRLKWDQLCVNYVYKSVARFIPTVRLPIISRMYHWSLEMGNWWESNWTWDCSSFRTSWDWLEILLCFRSQLCAAYSCRNSSRRRRSPKCCTISGLAVYFWIYCRAEICEDHASAAYTKAQPEALRKSKYSNYKDPFRPFFIYRKARSRQSHHLTISVGGTYSDHGGIHVFDCTHNHIVPTSARFLESPLLCKLFVCARIFISTSDRAHFALHRFHFVLHGFHYNLSMTIDFQQKELDDGWPESVEEQSLLLLVWRH